MSRIIQGDQYAVPFAITQDEIIITDGNVTGLRIKMGELERFYPDGGLTYSAGEQAWLFPVTQEETLAMRSMVDAQVEVVIGQNVFRSDVVHIEIGRSIILEPWGDGE